MKRAIRRTLWRPDPVLHDTHGLAAASRLTFQLFVPAIFSIGLSIT